MYIYIDRCFTRSDVSNRPRQHDIGSKRSLYTTTPYKYNSIGNGDSYRVVKPLGKSLRLCIVSARAG